MKLGADLSDKSVSLQSIVFNRLLSEHNFLVESSLTSVCIVDFKKKRMEALNHAQI